jgi:hypothetical protein
MSVYTPITGNPSYKLVFDDEFNGTSLDTSKWYPPVTQHDNTYANSNMTEMMAGNVSVHNGVLDRNTGLPRLRARARRFLESRLTSTGKRVSRTWITLRG